MRCFVFALIGCDVLSLAINAEELEAMSASSKPSLSGIKKRESESECLDGKDHVCVGMSFLGFRRRFFGTVRLR